MTDTKAVQIVDDAPMASGDVSSPKFPTIRNRVKPHVAGPEPTLTGGIDRLDSIAQHPHCADRTPDSLGTLPNRLSPGIATMTRPTRGSRG